MAGSPSRAQTLQSAQTDGIIGRMLDGFEWDADKARRNLLKHRVSFEEASEVFFDSRSLTVPDPDHSESEERFVTTGTSSRLRVLTVVHVDRDTRIRIISARRATARERKTYEKGL